MRIGPQVTSLNLTVKFPNLHSKSLEFRHKFKMIFFFPNRRLSTDRVLIFKRFKENRREGFTEKF